MKDNIKKKIDCDRESIIKKQIRTYFNTFYISLFIIIFFTGYLYKYQLINEITGLLVFLGLSALDIFIHEILTRRFIREKNGALLTSRGSKTGRLFGK